MKTDSIFYRLFLEMPGVYFQLMGQSPSRADSYEFRSVEIKQTAFRLDGVLIPKTESPTTPLYFCEVQMQKDTSFYRRVFAEIFLYLYQFKKAKHWRALVVFKNREIETKDTGPYQALLNSSNVTRVYLEDLGDEAYNNLGLGIVKLTVEEEETAMERGKKLATKAGEELADAVTREKVLELIKTILLYKFQELTPEEVLDMLGLDDFKKSRLYRGILEEGKLLGKLEVVPLLLEQGLSVEKIARRLNVTVELVQQAAQSQSN